MKRENKKIRVLHLIWRFEQGGLEQFLYNLMSNIDMERFQFDFAVCGDVLPGEFDKRLASSFIYHLPLISGRVGKKTYLCELEKLLKKEDYDAIHSHLAFMNAATLKVAKKCGVRCRISHVHVAGIGKKYSLGNIVKRVLMSYYSTARIACSKNTSDFYYLRFPKTEVVYSGVDVKRFLSRHKNGSGFVILGRFCHEKNPHFIVNTVKELQMIDPQLKVTWCGDGEMYQEVENYCKNNQIHIDFVGSVSNPEEYLKDASYMLMPSIREGFGMAAIEAQLSKVFVFASDCVPDETDLGLIEYYPLDSEKEWANRIASFINENRISEYSLNESRVDEFDMKNIAEKIVKIYNQ